ncbi:hypothetical protein EMA8858_04196 [Emticicia aquatica]|uniref:Uncharacterized protein n=1 Tax=Emticicia aquatica TaxID=1681835 RepID=A0ABM9AWS8_9BACT|nr:hypothetical protein EMA8858_04196 [Emticicia aquatica]
MPAVLTVMLVPVEVLLHLTVPAHPVALNVAISPLHKLFLLLLMTGATGVLPVVITTELLLPLSPQLFVQVAVYVPAVLTVMLVPVEVLLHLTVPAHPVALNVAVSPLHKLFLLLLITGATGVLPVVITIGFELPLSPQIVSHTAVYVPATLTVMLVPTDVLLHLTVPLQPVAINVAVSVPHNIVLVLVVTGVVGLTPTLIIIAFDELLLPQLLLHVAVYVPDVVTSNTLPLPPDTFQLKRPTHPLAVNLAFSPSQHIVLSDTTIGADGVLPVVITIGFELPLSPQLFVQVAVYVPAVLTVMLVPVEVLLHLTVPAHPVALNVALSPLHKLFLVVLMTGATGVLPVVITIGFELPLSPQLFVQVAVYVPAVLTVMLVPTDVLLHLTVPAQPVALNVAVSPLHKLFLVVLITGADGVLPVVITIGFEFTLSPQLFVQVAVYVPAVLTVMLVPVDVLLHLTVPAHPVALNVALSPLHKLFFVVLMTGADGVLPVVITIGFELPLSPQLFVQVAVYVPEVLTVMLVPVDVLLHLTVPAHPVALNVAVSPLHKLFLVVLINGATGVLPVVITIGFELPLSPQIVSHTAVYVPATLTVMLVPTDVLLHLTVPLQPVAINVAVSVPHNTVLVLVITGVVGLTPTLIIIAFDELLLPQLLLHVAVYVPDVVTSNTLPLPPDTFQLKRPTHPLAVNLAFSPSQHIVLSDTTIGADGVLPVVITIGFELPLSPQLFVQVAVYVPAVLTMMLVPVDVLLHLTVPAQPVALNVAVSPLHKLFLVVLMTGATGVLPVVITIGFELPLSPQLFVQVAVYVPATPTVMLVPVEVLLHLTVPAQPVALNVAVSVPHNTVLVLVITGVVGLTPTLIIIAFDELLLPQLLLHVAVYVPDVVTSNTLPLPPDTFQLKVPTHPLAVNLAFSPSQHIVLSDTTIGADGGFFLSITTSILLPLVPQIFVHVTVYVAGVVTVIVDVDSPLLHASVPSQPVAVNVADSPLQMAVLSALTIGAEGAFPRLISMTFELGLTPQIVSQTAAYVPATLTVILVPVAVVFHFTVPLQPVAVNIAVSVPQIVNLLAVIVGVVGVTPVRIITGIEDVLVPQIFVQVAE